MYRILLSLMVITLTLTSCKSKLEKKDKSLEEMQDEPANPETYQPVLASADATPIYKKINDSTEMHLNVYFPEGAKEGDAYPTIIYFFSGAFLTGSPAQFEEHCKYFSGRGMVAITADYRVIKRNKGNALNCIYDAKSAVRYIREHAAELHVDPNKVVVAGGSAGEFLALTCAIDDPKWHDPNDNPAISCVPNAMVLMNRVVNAVEHKFRIEKFKDNIRQDNTESHAAEVDPLTYTPVLQTLNFAVGEASKVVCVDILGDNNPEPNETVTLGITNVSTGTVFTGFAAQTILDNDQSVWSVVTAYPTIINTDEDGGNRLAYVVSRTGGINSVATIDVKTAGGTATAGVDYTPVNQTLTFAAGETNKLIWVNLLGDSLEEPNETVTMTIGNASTGTIIGTNTTQTILDNDQSVWSVGTLSSGDGEGGARLGFTVSRTGHINSAETIDFATTGGTATAGVDYTPVAQTLSFAAGETSKVVWINIASDLVPELSDTIVGTITNPSGGTLATSATTHTLVDNDHDETLAEQALRPIATLRADLRSGKKRAEGPSSPEEISPLSGEPLPEVD